MRSSKTTIDLRGRDALKLLGILACAVTLGIGATAIPASAMNIGATRSLTTPDNADTDPSRTQGFWDYCP
jgi:hypothetical protein